MQKSDSPTLLGENKEETDMDRQVSPIERRQHIREGIVDQLEDLTYTVLRKYGITGGVYQSGGYDGSTAQ